MEQAAEQIHGSSHDLIWLTLFLQSSMFLLLLHVRQDLPLQEEPKGWGPVTCCLLLRSETPREDGTKLRTKLRQGHSSHKRCQRGAARRLGSVLEKMSVEHTEYRG